MSKKMIINHRKIRNKVPLWEMILYKFNKKRMLRQKLRNKYNKNQKLGLLLLTVFLFKVTKRKKFLKKLLKQKNKLDSLSKILIYK